ncbi:MAG: hypothetical protein FWD18_03495 [Micrococcales bacterium]|nr:hypothetical protein [Micrococcales bacterium]
MRDKSSVERDLVAVRELPFGLTRTVAAERLVAEVEADGPETCLAFAYLVLVEAYAHGGEGSKSLVPYTRVLRLADERPDLLDSYDAHTLLWAGKWVVGTVIETPEVPVERVEALLADMERRFTLAGAGLDAIWYLRTSWADERDAPDTQAVYDTWVATPRDDFSQCSVCDPGDRAGYLMGWGRTDEAVRLIEQTLPAGERCLSEPADMLSRLALAYLDQGRVEEAVLAHRRTLAELDRAEVPLIGVRGKVLRFLARVGADDAVLRRIRDDETVMLAPGESAGYRMGALMSLGCAAQCVARSDPDRELRSLAAGSTTVAEYARWCRREADQIAATFDARYGDDHVSRRVAKAWEMVATPVDLSVLTASAAPAASDAPGAPPSTPATAPDTTEAVPQGAGTPATPGPAAHDLLARAEASVRHGDLAEAAPAYLEAGRLLVDEGMLADAGFAFAEAAHCAQILEDHEGAHATFARAVDMMWAGGVEPALVSPVVRAWTATGCAVGRCEQMLTWLDEVGSRLGDFSGLPDDETALLISEARLREGAAILDAQARAFATLGRWDEAIDVATAAAVRFGELAAHAEAGRAWWLVGRLSASTGSADTAIELYRRAAELVGRARDREQQVRVLDDLVRLLRELGRTSEADQVAADLLR